MPYPYYTEPSHIRGAVGNTSGNGAIDTSDISSQSRLVVDASDKVFLLEPRKHPLVTLLTNVGKTPDGKTYKGSGILKKVADQPEFSWFEDVYGARYATVAANYTNSDTSITVDGAGSNSAYVFTVGDLVKNASTGEIVLVTAIASSSALTVTRAFGSTSAAAGTDGDGLFIIGNVNEENGAARNSNITAPSKESNYTQIFRTTIPVTGTQMASKTYTGDEMKRLRAKKGTEHAQDIERAFWFGEKHLDTAGTQGHPRRATGGILEMILSGGSYTQNQGGALTEDSWNVFCREAFTYGNSTKTLFAGSKVVQALSKIAYGNLQTKSKDKTYGVAISEYVTPFGTINIVSHPMFVQDYAGSAFLVDLESFKYRYLENRDTKLRTGIQNNDIDGVVDEYLTEAGLERKQAPRHAYLYGVT